MLEYARTVHSAQSEILNAILNNTIDGVFAPEKRKQERSELAKYASNEIDVGIDEEDTEIKKSSFTFNIKPMSLL